MDIELKYLSKPKPGLFLTNKFLLPTTISTSFFKNQPRVFDKEIDREGDEEPLCSRFVLSR